MKKGKRKPAAKQTAENRTNTPAAAADDAIAREGEISEDAARSGDAEALTPGGSSKPPEEETVVAIDHEGKKPEKPQRRSEKNRRKKRSERSFVNANAPFQGERRRGRPGCAAAPLRAWAPLTSAVRGCRTNVIPCVSSFPC